MWDIGGVIVRASTFPLCYYGLFPLGMTCDEIARLNNALLKDVGLPAMEKWTGLVG